MKSNNKTAEAMNLLRDKRIAIIGAGPGGLTLARCLQLKGAKVTVYERDRDESARVQGAIVDLHFDSGLKVLERIGLMDAFKSSYMPDADKYRLVDKDGNYYLDEHASAGNIGLGDPRFRPEIDRGALRKLLLQALLPDTVVWDRQLQDMQRHNGVWELRFQEGVRASANIVIGCDGYRSRVRPHVTGVPALYSGATIIQGEIDDPARDCPEIYQLMSSANLIAMDTGKTIAVQPRGDGGLTFYAASLYPEHWTESSGIDFRKSTEVLRHLETYYAGWSPAFLKLFAACTQFVPRPLNYFPADQQWESQPDVTLVGDAAHLMPPSGEGVNTAMLDAFDLSEYLSSTEFNDLQEAIGAYEKHMLERAALLCREAVESISAFAGPSEESIRELVQMLTDTHSE